MLYQGVTHPQIVQLHHSLGQYRCTAMLGPKGSGITSCYHTLSAAYQRLGNPPIDITVINPAAYTWEQVSPSPSLHCSNL